MNNRELVSELYKILGISSDIGEYKVKEVISDFIFKLENDPLLFEEEIEAFYNSEDIIIQGFIREYDNEDKSICIIKLLKELIKLVWGYNEQIFTYSKN